MRIELRAFMPRSLAARLLLGSAAATLLALSVVLLLMNQVLTRFVTGQIDQRLDNKIVALVSQMRVASDGTLSLVGEADGPPFDKPHHRAFWIVQGPKNTLRTGWLSGDASLPSSSDLDAAFASPAPPAPGPGGLPSHPRSLREEGSDGVMLHERVSRTLVGGRPVTILVATPVDSIERPVGEAMIRVGLGVSALGVALAALAFLQVRLGLRPLSALRGHVAEIGAGRRSRLPTEQPTEIAPLVGEMNLLLERNAANLEKARRHVANLAHGLKTPLATLQLGVARLDGSEKEDLRRLLDEIDLRVRHHLGRARAAALAGPERARTPLAPRLARIEIADDGPGLRPDQIGLVQQPGRRLDEGVPGFGFGLAIARELIELYGGELALAPGTSGLVATVTLPASGAG